MKFVIIKNSITFRLILIEGKIWSHYCKINWKKTRFIFYFAWGAILDQCTNEIWNRYRSIRPIFMDLSLMWEKSNLLSQFASKQDADKYFHQYLVHWDQHWDELTFSGLNESHLVRFFDKVSLVVENITRDAVTVKAMKQNCSSILISLSQ